MFKTRNTRRLYAGDLPRLCTVIQSSGPRKAEWVSVFLKQFVFPVICVFKFRYFEIKIILNVIFFLLEQQIESIARRPTSPHPIQITKLIGHTEPEMDILSEKRFDGK